MTQRFYLNALGIINALGCGQEAVAAHLFAGDTSGMVVESDSLPDGQCVRVGRARPESALCEVEMREAWQPFMSRNSQLMLVAAGQIATEIAEVKARHGAARIAVVLGSSTSGIAESEAAMRYRKENDSLPAEYHYTQQEVGIPAVFLAQCLGVKGPAYTVSTACTSSAKAFVSARTLLQTGMCDAVIVGGVDSLCRLTVNGFSALESTSPEICLPLSRNRRGINIGEGAAIFLMTREPGGYEFLGAGESSDAYHISSPHPEGLGAERAMRAALADAGLRADEVDYLNLHATATQKNDEMESRAVSRVLGQVPVSGTKPLTGHTLGAAGATELAFCWLALRHNRLPPHVWDGAADPALPALRTVTTGQVFARQMQRVCMSNSFAFGGSNACLILGDAR